MLRSAAARSWIVRVDTAVWGLLLVLPVGVVAQTTGDTQTSTPVISTSAALNGAVVVTLSAAIPGAKIRYTLDGSAPGSSSQIYEAPFLVASSVTVRAVSQFTGGTISSESSKTFQIDLPPGTLVWSDEFANATSAEAQPDSQVWAYVTGHSGFGNNEEEHNCAWGSNADPCSSAHPNAFIGPDGFLHIVARKEAAAVYTSARLRTRGRISFQYGRIEARMKLPETQGMWPAFWLLGNNNVTVDWPACGELDVMEHVNGKHPEGQHFDWIQGSIHGTALNNHKQYARRGFSAAAWHTYGVIWSKGKIEYYVDDPSQVYATFTPSTQAGTWPFDTGPAFLLLDLAVGGTWPGSPSKRTQFPSEMLVDYVRVFTNEAK
jgi:beta-glucanase (GH16 family)